MNAGWGRLAKIALLCLTTCGCAYVEYVRQYDVWVKPREAAPAEEIERVFETYLSEKGLILREKYEIVAPQQLRVVVFEIPRDPQAKRRRPFLFLLMRKDRDLQLRHSEWFFSPTSDAPDDFIASIKEELVARARRELSANIGMALSERRHY
jgi:hypothetical protein